MTASPLRMRTTCAVPTRPRKVTRLRQLGLMCRPGLVSSEDAEVRVSSQCPEMLCPREHCSFTRLVSSFCSPWNGFPTMSTILHHLINYKIVILEIFK